MASKRPLTVIEACVIGIVGVFIMLFQTKLKYIWPPIIVASLGYLMWFESVDIYNIAGWAGWLLLTILVLSPIVGWVLISIIRNLAK